MKGVRKGPLPWDIAVFLTVTIVGFGYTVQKFSRSLGAMPEPARTMASLAPEPGAFTSRSESKTLDLGCLEQRDFSDRVLVENSPLRLKGRFCDPKEKGAGSLRVRNLSNGTEATVFFRGDGLSFVTDYLPLEAGQNRVQIEWKAAAQAQTRTVLADVLSTQR